MDEPNWSLSIRRSQVLNALVTALDMLSRDEDAYLAWRQASTQTETQLQRLLGSAHLQHNLYDQVCNVTLMFALQLVGYRVRGMCLSRDQLLQEMHSL